jgi:hypothetical protein
MYGVLIVADIRALNGGGIVSGFGTINDDTPHR